MTWDYTTDFLVVGSGAGGMTAAVVAAELGADSLVIEKTDCYGGTTALSGGGIWIPANDAMLHAGLNDSEEEAVGYLQQVIGPAVSENKIRAYVRNGRKMVRFMDAHTPVKFISAIYYSDYYPEFTGGKIGGRTMDPMPFDFFKLGTEFNLMRRSLLTSRVLPFSMTMSEAREMMSMSAKGILIAVKHLLRYAFDIPARLRGWPDRRLTLGGALVARCRRAMLDRNVPLWLHTDAKELIVENDCVVGMRVEKEGKSLRIRAQKGVLLAAGGMAHNIEMRQQFNQLPNGEGFSSASEGDTGDAIRMGIARGAALEFMDCAWWTPSTQLPDGSMQVLIVSKSMPGGIFVDSNGQRFCNEAAPYEDVTKAQWRNHRERASSVPSYLIFDARYRHNYPIGVMPPGKMKGDDKIKAELIDTGFLKKANSLRELAQQINIDADRLEQTIARHNEFARTGKDLDFGRGDSATDRYYSDAKIKPNPNLAPIITAPFYAVAVYPGDLGTKGGLKCDEFARVLDQTDQPIAGLYATGNCAGAVMGNSYPGAGSTIGPAMTFGYVAARHALGIDD